MNWAAQVDPTTANIGDKANGATMLSIPIGHTVDALCHCLGEFQSLSATMAIRQPFMTRSDTGERLIGRHRSAPIASVERLIVSTAKAKKYNGVTPHPELNV